MALTPRNRTHPACDNFPLLLVDADRWSARGRIRFPKGNGSDPVFEPLAETFRCRNVTWRCRWRVYAASMMATTVGQQQLMAARAAFAEGDARSLGVLPLPLQQSWLRSRAAGLLPGQEPDYRPLLGDGRHLSDPGDRRLARCVRPELEQLWAAFGGRGWTMFCANREGMVIAQQAHGLKMHRCCARSRSGGGWARARSAPRHRQSAWPTTCLRWYGAMNTTCSGSPRCSASASHCTISMGRYAG